MKMLQKNNNEPGASRSTSGILPDLEELHEGRIDDFIAGQQTLRAADMNKR